MTSSLWESILCAQLLWLGMDVAIFGKDVLDAKCALFVTYCRDFILFILLYLFIFMLRFFCHTYYSSWGIFK